MRCCTEQPGRRFASRRLLLDRLKDLHLHAAEQQGDGEVDARIAQYEVLPDAGQRSGVMDVSNETDETFDLYGKDSRTPGLAANCLLARRLAEKGVKFVQLYHQGWDQHDNLPRDIERQCRETDQASAALIIDLKRRGLLDDTLVVWGGEFGRTSYSQGKLTTTNYGRDHHPRKLQPVDGGWRRQARPRLRRDRRLQLQRRRAPGPRARLPRDIALSARHRSRAVDVPLSGTPLPIDRRARAGREGPDRLTAPPTPDPGSPSSESPATSRDSRNTGKLSHRSSSCAIRGRSCLASTSPASPRAVSGPPGIRVVRDVLELIGILAEVVELLCGASVASAKARDRGIGAAFEQQILRRSAIDVAKRPDREVLSGSPAGQRSGRKF